MIFSSKLIQKTIVFLVLLVIVAKSEAQIYVDVDATGSANGLTWADAYNNLQDALDNATAGDIIWVASGTYKPTVDDAGNSSPADERTKTFQLIEGVSMYGGFAGTETMLIERDPDNNKTILSGDIGTADDMSDNCYHVLMAADSIVFNGFIVEKGNSTTRGGGMYVGSSMNNILIEHCDFRENNADESGGAIFFNGYSNTNIHINHTVFYKNTSNEGGAVRATTSTVNLSYCTFIENTGTDMGGGIMYWGDEAGSPEIVNCSFIRNTSADGGALHGRAINIRLQVKNSLFYDNTGDDIGLTNSATDTVSYSRITQAGYTGNHNTDHNPLFISSEYGNIVLDDISPCIDAGDPLSPPDPDGSNADMGSTFGIDLQGKYLIGSSPSADFATFTEAVDSLINHVVSGPVIFNVESGTYNEQINIPEISGASGSAEIIFQSITGDSTDVILTYAATDEAENYTVKLDGADYITFKNMTLQATGATYARVVEVTNETKHIGFLNNRFEGVENTGELVFNINNPVKRDSSIVFSNNYFLNGKKAIQWNSSYDMSITDNMFYHQHDTAVFMIYGRVTSIKDNLFYSNHRTTAISLNENNFGFAIENNRIYLKNGGRGIDILQERGVNNTLINNYIYLHTNQNDIGIFMFSGFSPTLQSFHNTIHIAGDNPSSICFQNAQNSSISLQSNNNNFVNMAGGLVVKDWGSYGDYNNLYSNGSYLASSRINLEMLQLEDNREPNSISVNPYFVSDTSWATTHWALNNSGLEVGVTEDIEGNARITETPDIGAAEFTPPPPVPFQGSYVIGGATPDFETLNEAVDALIMNGIDGTVAFSIAADTLHEFVRIPEIDGASATNTITFTSAGNDTAVLQSNHRYTLYLDGADFITFDRLKILNEYATSVYYPSNVILANGANNNRFTNNYLTRENTSNSHLIHVLPSVDTNIVIASNTFENTSNGIYFEGNDSILENGNQIIDNVFNNYIWRCIRMNRQQNFLINGNILDTRSYYQIAVTGSKNGLISNNMIHSREAFESFRLQVDDCDSLKIYYNTIKTLKGIPMTLDGRHLDVKNNILVNDPDAYAPAIQCEDSTGFKSDYNVFYSYSSLNKMNWLGQNLESLEAWQDSSGHDANSLFLMPQFVSDMDLHINDLRINYRGTPIPDVMVDIDGDPRDANHPDIGADEADLGVPMAGEYYIGPSRMFKSFSEAVDSLLQVGMIDSITFLVDEGTYNEQVVIPYIPNVAAERPVVFRPTPENTGDVIVEYAANNTDHYVIKLDSAQYVTLENMTINALDTAYATAIYMVNGTHDVTVSNNIITSKKNPQTSAVKIEDGNNYNIRVSGNTISGGFNGIDFKGEDGNPSVGNILTGNTLLNQYHSGIFMQYQKWQQISKNRISHPDPIENIWIGIDLYDCAGNYDSSSFIVNNMIDYHATEQSAGLALFNCRYQNIYHNNIHVHGSSSESRTLNLQDGCSMINTYNNILSNTAGGVLLYSPDLSTKYFDYNVLHTTEDRFIYAGGWIDDLEAWNAAGKGANSLTLDPLFVSDSDLHINQLQLFGKGMPIPEITEDFDGDARDSENTTIGADVMTGTCTEPLSGVIPIGTGETYESVNDAVTALILCGMEGTVVFEIAPGTYNEQVLLPENFTGKTPEDSIVFRSASGNAEDAIVTYNATKDYNYVIKLDGLDNFVLQNITLEAQNSQYGRLIEIDNHVNNSLFEGNIFKGIATRENNDSIVLIYFHPESVDSSQVFINNTFINGSRAIVKENASTKTDVLEIRKNQFTNQGNGILTFENINLILFEENTVQTNTTVFRGIEGGMVDSLSICQNIIRAEVQEGIFLDSYTETIFMANNFISFESFSNKQLNVIKVDNEFYCYHNTMVISGNNPNSNIYYNSGTNNYIIEFKNNVAVNLARGKVFEFYYNFPNYTSDYNNLFSNGELFGKYGGNTYDHFQDYVSTSGLDANSVSANPAFLNDSTWYSQHILHSNTGTPIPGITTDLDGNVRDAVTPDMGAEEFEYVRYSLGDDIRACAGDEVVLNAGVGFDSYLWSTGSGSATTAIDTLGTGMGQQEVWVTVGLNGNQYKDTITVDLNLPVANPVTDYCYNENKDSILISAGEGVEYLWSNGKRTQSFYITGGNWYYVTVTDEYGCSNDGAIQIHYNECVANVGMPGDSVITENDSIVIESNQCRYDYEQFDYTWSTGDTTYLVTLYGSDLGIGTHEIVVTVTNYGANGCTSSDTVHVTVDKASGFENWVLDAISVFPNPTNGRTTIQGERITSVEVYNVLGNLLYKDNNRGTYAINLDNEPNGIYLVKIYEGERVITRKIILQH